MDEPIGILIKLQKADIHNKDFWDNSQVVDDVYYSGLELFKVFLSPETYDKILREDYQNANDLYFSNMEIYKEIIRHVPKRVREMPLRVNYYEEDIRRLNLNEIFCTAISKWLVINVFRSHKPFETYWADGNGKYHPGYPREKIGKPLEKMFLNRLKKNPWILFISNKQRKEAIHSMTMRERKISRKRPKPPIKICPVCKEEYGSKRSDKLTCDKDKCRKKYYRDNGPVRERKKV
jgi:hypothetical protein